MPLSLVKSRIPTDPFDDRVSQADELRRCPPAVPNLHGVYASFLAGPPATRSVSVRADQKSAASATDNYLFSGGRHTQTPNPHTLPAANFIFQAQPGLFTSEKNTPRTDGRRAEQPAASIHPSSEACYSLLHILVTVSTLLAPTATVTTVHTKAVVRLRDFLRARLGKGNELRLIKKVVFLFVLCGVLCCACPVAREVSLCLLALRVFLPPFDPVCLCCCCRCRGGGGWCVVSAATVVRVLVGVWHLLSQLYLAGDSR